MQHFPEFGDKKEQARRNALPRICGRPLTDKAVVSSQGNRSFLPREQQFPAEGTDVSRRGNCCAKPM